MKRIYILAFLIAAANVLLGAEIFLYSQNTLFLAEAWRSTKRTLEVTAWGSDSFLITRAALARGRLDLGAWGGYNEVLTKEAFTPRRISLRLRLEPGAYLAVIFNRSAAGFRAVRLSRRPDRPAALLRGEVSGRILAAEPLGWPQLDGAWHRLEIDFAPAGAAARIDGEPPLALAGAEAAAGSFGLRSGRCRAVVDDVRIEEAGGVALRESFRNTRHWPRTLLGNCVLMLILFAWLRRRRGGPAAFAAGNLTLLACGLLWLAFDRFYWSGLELDALSCPLSAAARPRFVDRAESARQGFFAGWNRLLGGQAPSREALVRQGYAEFTTGAGPIFCGRALGERPRLVPPGPELEALLRAPKTARRILFVGTSQAVGAGAPRLADTFPFLTHAALSAALGPARPIETLNMSVSGADSTALLDEYRRVYARFRPDLVVLDLSNNDRPGQLAEGIAGFLALNRRSGIRSILIKEANSDEAPDPSALLGKHRVLDEAARRFGVPVYDLHGYLIDPAVYRTGFLWWDDVHLTPWGQELAARWLLPKVRAELDRARR